MLKFKSKKLVALCCAVGLMELVQFLRLLQQVTRISFLLVVPEQIINRPPVIGLSLIRNNLPMSV